ncbi:hypothetical protein JTE90_027793 [Oedothorax gibbosus]|uniref:Ubiquitin-like protease family profile domain-containing protein n=1 Tax=Oedothorax gibbosus TaxID=931172 RepID=A0AAV6V611_9ARAC|nr:hypothetical protein JTE90_027793 [Oedothorax gibbosus]
MGHWVAFCFEVGEEVGGDVLHFFDPMGKDSLVDWSEIQDFLQNIESKGIEIHIHSLVQGKTLQSVGSGAVVRNVSTSFKSFVALPEDICANLQSIVNGRQRDEFVCRKLLECLEKNRAQPCTYRQGNPVKRKT